MGPSKHKGVMIITKKGIIVTKVTLLHKYTERGGLSFAKGCPELCVFYETFLNNFVTRYKSIKVSITLQ